MSGFYSAFPGPLDRSRRFTSIIAPADLNIPEPSRLPGKYTHAAATEASACNNPQYTSLSLARCPFYIHMGEVRKLG